MSWSMIAPPGNSRPLLLEQTVNDGIAGGKLQTGVRSAIRTAFGLQILAPSRGGLLSSAGQTPSAMPNTVAPGSDVTPPTRNAQLAPVFPSHVTLMSQLPAWLTRGQRQQVGNILCHLERYQISWSKIAPPGNSRPALLEHVVNDGIARGELDPSAHGVLNGVFGLQLQATRSAPPNP